MRLASALFGALLLSLAVDVLGQQINTGGFTASWKITGSQSNQMLFKIGANTAGTTGPWAAISMDPNGKSHVASDMYVGYMSTAGSGVLDSFSSSQSQPLYDASQDAQSVSVQVTGGNLNFSFVRNFQTADTSNDYQIAAGNTVTVGWAFGSGSSGSGAGIQYNYHGTTNRGNANFDLVATALTPAPTTAGTTLAPTSAPTTVSPTTAAPTFGPTPALTVPSGSFTYQSPNKDFTAIWSISSTNITMQMSATTNGYVGVSFSNVTLVSHSSSDTIVGWITSAGAINIVDAFSNTFIQPVFDTTTQDVKLVSGTQNTQGVSISFTRFLKNNDPTQDYQFNNNGVGTNLGWAYAFSAPSGTGANAMYAQHPVTTRGNAKIDMFTGNAISTTQTPAAGVKNITTSDGNTVVLWKLVNDSATGKDAFQFNLTSPAGAKWVGVGFSKTTIHAATDFYVAFANSAGIQVVDLYSNDQTTTQNVDTSQDAKRVSGNVTSSGQIKATFTRLANTSDTTQDVVISNSNLVMGIAFASSSAPTNPTPGQTTTYGSHTPGSSVARSFFTVNLYSAALTGTTNTTSNTESPSEAPTAQKGACRSILAGSAILLILGVGSIVGTFI
jgi:hypothetical protein